VTGDIQLHTLEAKGLIRLAAVRPELEYLFRHWLVQDAAYGSLLKQERRILHGQVGEALETLYPDRRAELAAVLAMHFEQAGETDRAIGYYIEAGTYGLKRNAIHEAFAAFDRAAALLPPSTDADSPSLRRRRIEAELGRAEAGYGFRPMIESLEEFEAIIPEAERLGDHEVMARVYLLAAFYRLQGGDAPSSPEVRRSLDRVAAIGETLGDPSLIAMPLALIGTNQVFVGPVREGVAALEQALPLLHGKRDSIGVAFARGSLAMGYATLGEFGKAEEAVRHATEMAAAQGDLVAQLDALIAESIVRSARGQLDLAVPLAERCVAWGEETGATGCVMVSAWVLGDAYHRQGRLADARTVLGRGAEISGIVDRKVWRPTLQAWLGTTATAFGEAAGGDWDEALETARSIGNRLGEAGILAKRAEAAVSLGRVDEALADYAAGAALFEAEGARPSLARLLDSWGSALLAAGRREEADGMFRRAVSLFDEMGLDREASATRGRRPA
jgi:tetratricopeptide (TPR) repeat protein